MSVKSSSQLEVFTKSIANRKRRDILFFLEQNPESTLEEIACLYGGKLAVDYRTVSQHTRKLLHRAGMLYKRNRAAYVVHSISPYGRRALRFLRTF